MRVRRHPSNTASATTPGHTMRGMALAAGLVLLGVFAPAQADGLAPGEFRWTPELAPTGSDTVVVVSLPEQRAHVYRNGVRIGLSTVSTGKSGKETPTGVFPILQKRKEHYSNLYDNAPMPYMQRLTWDGIALHGGKIPGYPASNGCVRLPGEFARKLFEATGFGTIVVVADHGSHDPAIVSPGDRSPVDPTTGLAWATPQAPDYQERPAQGVAGIDRVEVLHADAGSRGDGIAQ
jgi:hypothetical protein